MILIDKHITDYILKHCLISNTTKNFLSSNRIYLHFLFIHDLTPNDLNIKAFIPKLKKLIFVLLGTELEFTNHRVNGRLMRGVFNLSINNIHNYTSLDSHNDTNVDSSSNPVAITTEINETLIEDTFVDTTDDRLDNTIDDLTRWFKSCLDFGPEKQVYVHEVKHSISRFLDKKEEEINFTQVLKTIRNYSKTKYPKIKIERIDKLKKKNTAFMVGFSIK